MHLLPAVLDFWPQRSLTLDLHMLPHGRTAPEAFITILSKQLISLTVLTWLGYHTLNVSWHSTALSWMQHFHVDFFGASPWSPQDQKVSHANYETKASFALLVWTLRRITWAKGANWARANMQKVSRKPCKRCTSDENMVAHVPMHQHTTGLVILPSTIPWQMLYSSVPPI